MKEAQKVIMSGELKLGSLTMKVYTLEDGTPLIDEQSMYDFMEWLGSGELTSGVATQEQMEELGKFIHESKKANYNKAISNNLTARREMSEQWITIINERTRAIIVRVDCPTGQDYIYSEHGFNRELQIIRDGEIVHKSGAHHPESRIETEFEGQTFLALAGNDKDIFILLKGKNKS